MLLFSPLLHIYYYYYYYFKLLRFWQFPIPFSSSKQTLNSCIYFPPWRHHVLITKWNLCSEAVKVVVAKGVYWSCAVCAMRGVQSPSRVSWVDKRMHVQFELTWPSYFLDIVKWNEVYILVNVSLYTSKSLITYKQILVYCKSTYYLKYYMPHIIITAKM